MIQTLTPSRAGLADQQLAFYRAFGFIVLRQLFNREENPDRRHFISRLRDLGYFDASGLVEIE